MIKPLDLTSRWQQTQEIEKQVQVQGEHEETIRQVENLGCSKKKKGGGGGEGEAEKSRRGSLNAWKKPMSPSTHILVSKYYCPLKGNRNLWRIGQFQVQSRKVIRRTWNLFQRVEKPSKSIWIILKELRNHFEEFPTGLCWENSSNHKNKVAMNGKTSNKLKNQ